MRIFYDCEIVERGRDLPMQLVSVGMVREDGEELYAINEECLSNVIKHPWLSINAVPHLPILRENGFNFSWDRAHPQYDNVMALDQIVAEVGRFVTGVPGPELWAYYGAYKHVAICQLFGSIGELPPNFPMFTHDIQQLAEDTSSVVLPGDPMDVHHALADARWVHNAYYQLRPLTGGSVSGPVIELSSTAEQIFPGFIEDSHDQAG